MGARIYHAQRYSIAAFTHDFFISLEVVCGHDVFFEIKKLQRC